MFGYCHVIRLNSVVELAVNIMWYVEDLMAF